jgi:multidrug efflux pump subunit AcrA (membrane-fusion protein)
MKTAALVTAIVLSAASQAPPSPATPGLQARPAGPETRKIVYESKGYIVPVGQVSVSPKVGGQVIEMTIEEGKFVNKGEILARLENGEYKAELNIAKARLELARARAEKSKGETVAIARAEVAVAAAAVEKAFWRFDATVIRAPISGTILTKRAEVGSVLNPAAFNVSASICEMADLRELEVDVSVPERDIGKIAKGQSCSIRPEAFPATQYKGKVSRLMPVADRARGALAVRVRVAVPNGDTRLRPEMAALVTFFDRD